MPFKISTRDKKEDRKPRRVSPSKAFCVHCKSSRGIIARPEYMPGDLKLRTIEDISNSIRLARILVSSLEEELLARYTKTIEVYVQKDEK